MGDFDFVEHYGEAVEANSEELLPKNEAVSSLNCAFVGIGGGGGNVEPD